MNTRFTKLNDSKRIGKAAAVSLAALIGLAALPLNALAAPPAQQQQLRQQQYAQLRQQQYAQYRQQLAQAKQNQNRTQPQQKQQQARKKPLTRAEKIQARQVLDKLILVMPNKNAEMDDLKQAMEDVHGTVVGSIGKGPLKVLLVKSENGKLAETERKLKADKKNFTAVSFNRRIKASYAVPKDPTAGSAWHLRKMNCLAAWDVGLGTLAQFGQRSTIAVLDSGCSWMSDTGIGSNGVDVSGGLEQMAHELVDEMDGFLGTGLFGDDVEDLEDEMLHWANYAQTMSYGFQDNHGHGTWVACAAAGRENGKASVGVAPGAHIYPIKIADGPMGTDIYADEASMVAGMIVAINSGARIVNISYGTLNDQDSHEVLYELFKYFYDHKNGIIFNSAGNDGEHMPYKDSIYLNTVSALKQKNSLGKDARKATLLLVDGKATGGWSSNTGRCVDFCAPGIDIPVANPDGTIASVGGTSFSSPIVAAIAALCLSVNPNLSNRQVECILINSCVKPPNGAHRDDNFGFGMPDAEKAVQMAVRGG